MNSPIIRLNRPSIFRFGHVIFNDMSRARLITLILVAAVSAYGLLFTGCIQQSAPKNTGENVHEKDCNDCHSLTLEEAKNILKEIGPSIVVEAVTKGPVKGLWQVAVNNNGQKTVVYIDTTKKILIQGQILDLAAKRDLTMEAVQELNKIDFSSIPLDDALVVGDKKAPIKVVVLDDPD